MPLSQNKQTNYACTTIIAVRTNLLTVVGHIHKSCNPKIILDKRHAHPRRGGHTAASQGHAETRNHPRELLTEANRSSTAGARDIFTHNRIRPTHNRDRASWNIPTYLGKAFSHINTPPPKSNRCASWGKSERQSCLRHIFARRKKNKNKAKHGCKNKSKQGIVCIVHGTLKINFDDVRKKHFKPDNKRRPKTNEEAPLEAPTRRLYSPSH